jgi:hypothetical protein
LSYALTCNEGFCALIILIPTVPWPIFFDGSGLLDLLDGTVLGFIVSGILNSCIVYLVGYYVERLYEYFKSHRNL